MAGWATDAVMDDEEAEEKGADVVVPRRQHLQHRRRLERILHRHSLGISNSVREVEEAKLKDVDEVSRSRQLASSLDSVSNSDSKEHVQNSSRVIVMLVGAGGIGFEIAAVA